MIKYFKRSEFDCPDCGQEHMEDETLEMLDHAREVAGVPFSITSGWRCPKHNKEVDGKEDSAHLTGKAADVAVSSSRARYRILNGLIQAGFTRIGIAKGFIHADSDGEKPIEVVWLY